VSLARKALLFGRCCNCQNIMANTSGETILSILKIEKIEEIVKKVKKIFGCNRSGATSTKTSSDSVTLKIQNNEESIFNVLLVHSDKTPSLTIK
jgi:hypothetical protein